MESFNSAASVALQIRLSAYTTCEASDALIKLGVSHGGHIPDIHTLSPLSGFTRLCGRAYTVRMVLKSEADHPGARLEGHFIDAVPDECVIVIDAPLGAKNAVWGGLMTAGARARHARGVIISGRCRDISEHGSCGFPVFARGQSTVGQSPFTRPSAINVRLDIPTGAAELDGAFPPTVVVEPGDWMLGDEDGVVCIPQGMVERVIELASAGREVDARCLDDINNGAGVQETFRKHRSK